MYITVRGRTIQVAAKHGNRQHYMRLYESLSNERLDELAQESLASEQLQVQGYNTSKDGR